MSVEAVAEYLHVGRITLVNSHPQRMHSPRIQAVMRGWRRGGYILFDWPVQRDQAIHLRTGRECVIEFLHEGKACGFAGSILDAGSRAHPQFCVAWPDEVETIALRQHERVPTCLPCEVNLTGGTHVEAEIRDISAGGCKIVLACQLPPDVVVELTFHAASWLRFENARACIRNCVKVPEGFACGCEFDEFTEQDRQNVEFLVAGELEQLRSGGEGKHSVLVLDDDLKNAQHLKGALEGNGVDVSSAPCLVEAFYSLRKRSPNAVVLKQDLKELPGSEVCRIVRASRGFESVPIVVYGDDHPETREKALKAGATYYACEPEEVLRFLESVE
ncbi:MAG: response regulator [bacterium]|nr:response regulator [bacterium]